jgi:Uma2 family endonuclease
MASIPLTEEQVGEDFVILDFGRVGLSDEQFVELCADNPELHLELTARKELVIMTLPPPPTGRRNDIICRRLGNWAEKDGTGVSFTPTLFALPNGAKRAPDAAWMKLEKWNSVSDEQKEGLSTPLCPDFVVELMSKSDRRPVRFRMLQAKMDEYLANGVQLGWMIDPFQKRVYVYRPNARVECLENPTTISGDPVLPGFIFDVAELWRQ